MMPSIKSCAILTIGDELLIGQTIDTNSAWIAKALEPLGIQIKMRLAVGDVKQDILEALNHLRIQADLIIMTGGLGPTADDITKPLLVEYFKTELVWDASVLKHVTHYFEQRKRPLLESNQRQALLPANCEVLFNQMGTAPGMWFEDGNNFFVSLPGVPFEMQHIMQNEVIPRLRKQVQQQTITHRTLITAGVGESFLAEKLRTFEQNLPKEIKLAYLPQLGMVKLRLSTSELSESIVEHYFQELIQRTQEHFVVDQDRELEGVVGDLLSQRKQRVACVESCTGGALANRITAVKGASNYFQGSFVTYTPEMKNKVLGIDLNFIELHGAVSEEVAVEMAKSGLMQWDVDYCIAISGLLEKGDEDNRVWIALAHGNITEAHKIFVPYDRIQNTVLTTTVALNLLRKFILANSVK